MTRSQPSSWILGDLHGCVLPLEALLDRLDADLDRDHFYFVGDLVNRGPASLATLRLVMRLGERAIVTLGNHDLHLLAVLHGIRKPGRKDTLSNILSARDRGHIIDWLRHRSVMHETACGDVIVHAGIHPHWTLSEARTRARELESALRSDDYLRFLGEMYGNEPAHPDRATTEIERLRASVNVFTRMRYCHADGRLEFEVSGPPASAPQHLTPWYALPGRQPVPQRIVFGHWSAHPAMAPPGIVPTDRGCVWGGWLAGLSLGTGIMKAVRAQTTVAQGTR